MKSKDLAGEEMNKQTMHAEMSLHNIKGLYNYSKETPENLIRKDHNRPLGKITRVKPRNEGLVGEIKPVV